MRRSLTTPITLAVIGLVLLPMVSNIAANAIPDSWEPHLWLAWPAGALLAVPMIYGEIRDRRRGQYPEATTLDRAARDLAMTVHRQWTQEAGLRGLRSPEPIWVRWSSTDRPVARELSKVLDADAVDSPPRLHGDLPQVIDAFCRTKYRQLVILGEPTAGKSVLALLFVLGLPPDEPVPVLLAVSSWDPHQEDLHAWVARRIVEEYPWLANSDVYGRDAAVRLIADGRVLPVLDGLDEMSAELRPVAIKAIDRTVTDQYPLVVTCRTTEYHDAVHRNGGFVAHAAVLKIHPVAIGDAVSFLSGADPQRGRWKPVVEHLQANPDGPLACALRSPLMIDLARTVYNVPGGNPAEMADTTKFSGQHEVERHLFDAFLRVAYQNRTAPGSQPGGTLARYPEERAGAWLRFLARHLTATGAQHFAWWRLEHAVSRPVRGVLVGLVAAPLVGLAVGLLFHNLVLGLACAVTYGLAVGFAGTFGRIREPSRVRITFRGHGPSLIRRLTASLVVSSIALPFIGPVKAVVFAGTLAVALVAHLWLNSAPGETAAASPALSLRWDRNGALLLAAALLLTFGVLPGLLFNPASLPARPPDTITIGITVIINAIVGAVMGGFLFGRTGAVTIGIAEAIASWLAIGLTGFAFPDHSRLAMIAYTALVGVAVAVLGVLTRAWGAFTLARLWLALRGRLPLRLMRFLDDAHRRGVLRQSGTTYQFRHERLHNHIRTARRGAARVRSDAVISDPMREQDVDSLADAPDSDGPVVEPGEGQGGAAQDQGGRCDGSP